MGQDSASTASLFDFLYVDSERVSSLTAQLFGAGVITSVKQTETDGDSSSKSVELNIKVAKAKLGSSDNVSASQERLFDASWSLPLNLLDRLQELDLIKKDIEALRLGDLTLATGHIKIFDIAMVQQLMPAAKKLAKNNAKGQSARKQISELDMAEEIVKFLPKSVQIEIADADGNLFWTSVSPENLAIPPADMMLKYGPIIPGKWHVLGLLDAHRDGDIEDPDAPYPTVSNEFKDSINFLSYNMRLQVGRPSCALGITPLLIFRKIG
ncbi:DUF6414 family protein [Rosenbergiella epipactidis]|uniref:DUF6414 family protein n=1 Tax=Rosenbergiella epipactidis TaxID=1544694 RepID=UPI001F4D7EA9|nr:hypothetical protein [Rosenbergiella epipactidis]